MHVMKRSTVIAALFAILCLLFQAGAQDQAEAGWRKAQRLHGAGPALSLPRYGAVRRVKRDIARQRRDRRLLTILPRPRQGVLTRIAQNRPSARAIEKARQRRGLPASAHVVNVRPIKRNGRQYWRIIFLDGIRQVPVDVPARR